MKRKVICSVVLVTVLVFGNLGVSSAETAFGVMSTFKVPMYYQFLLGKNTASGINIGAFYQVTELYGFPIMAQLERSEIRFDYTFPNDVAASEIELNDLALSFHGRYDFSSSFEKFVGYYLSAKLSLHSLTSTIFVGGLNTPKEQLDPDAQPYSYNGKILPSLTLAFGVCQPIIKGLAIFAEFGLDSIFAGSDFLPGKDGLLIVPQIQLGAQFAIQKF